MPSNVASMIQAINFRHRSSPSVLVLVACNGLIKAVSQEAKGSACKTEETRSDCEMYLGAALQKHHPKPTPTQTVMMVEV